MSSKDIIPIQRVCETWRVETSFIDELFEMGLLQVVTVQEDRFIEISQLRDLERMIRFHHDLAINAEGIAVIIDLLHKMDGLQEEINYLRNRLSFYE